MELLPKNREKPQKTVIVIRLLRLENKGLVHHGTKKYKSENKTRREEITMTKPLTLH